VTEPKNDRNHAVTKFCLDLEKHRRSDGGRVRTAKEFLDHFFPHDDREATDRIFLHMPNTVRGPILAKWGIRGARAALKDDAPKIKLVVHDALIAGDVDENSFESGVDAATIIDWIDLPAWWTFWRSGKLTGAAVQKALATVRALALIDDAWFLASLRGRAGKTKGTDVVCEMLAKDQLVAWIRKIHETGDASPTGLIQAIGWDVVLAKAPYDALLSVLDEFARKAGLAPQEPFVKRSSVEMTPPPIEPLTARHQRSPEARMPLSAPFDAAAIAEADALANVALRDSQASRKCARFLTEGKRARNLLKRATPF
jgi:hypothetical protein